MSSCQKVSTKGLNVQPRPPVPQNVLDILKREPNDGSKSPHDLYWYALGNCWTVIIRDAGEVLNPNAAFSATELEKMCKVITPLYEKWNGCDCCTRHKENPLSGEQTQFLSEIGFVTSHNSLTTPLKNEWRCDCPCRHNMRGAISFVFDAKQPENTWVFPQRPECPECPK